MLQQMEVRFYKENYPKIVLLQMKQIQVAYGGFDRGIRYAIQENTIM